MQPRVKDDRASLHPTDFIELAQSIERALYTFESTSNHALLRMYRNGNVSISNSRASIGSLGSENQVLLGDESENVFLVYLSVLPASHCHIILPHRPCSFIFTMQEYARELISLVDAMGRICSIERTNVARNALSGQLKRLLGLGLYWKSGRNPRERSTRGRPTRGRSTSIRKRFCMYLFSPSFIIFSKLHRLGLCH